jgi:ABC-type methionine transport system permease subunit
MVSVFCVVVPGVLFGYIVYTCTTTMQITNEWIYDVFMNCSVPYVIIICLLWVYFHFRFFHNEIV